MSKVDFFPSMLFAWVFVLGLIAATTVAAWIDTRKAIVPNRLTVATLLAGLALNLIRGAWNGSLGRPLWLFPPESGLFLGGVDGLLFGLAGFAAAFALLLGFWLLGLCGGGDVKLFAATGGWLGWEWFLLLWLASLVVLFVWTAGRLVTGMAGGKRSVKPGKLRLTYSLPIAVATVVTLFWVFRVELQLAPPSNPVLQPQGAARDAAARPPV